MDRQEAERIYEADREEVIKNLLKMDARIRELEQTIARLTRNSTNSSKRP
jgi:prefoldin subunit 5